MAEAKTRWTTGPWFVSGVRFRMGGGEWHGIGSYNAARKRDESIACVGFDPRTGDGFADAHLIAAAPELYEALEAIMMNEYPFTGEYDEQHFTEHLWREKALGNGAASMLLTALAALAKARGE